MLFMVAVGIDTAVNLNVPVEYDNSSNGILDTKLSSKYPITLEQARIRVLRAIKRAREKDKWLN